MEIELALDKNDLIILAQYQADHSTKLRERGQRLRWSYTIAFAMVALGSYLIFPDVFLSVVFGVLAIISAIFYPFIHQWRVRQNIDRIVEERSTPGSFAIRKFTATPEGLEEKSEYAETKVKWNLVDDVEITPTHTFISIEGVYSVIIPKVAIKNGDYKEFTEAIEHYYTNNKISRDDLTTDHNGQNA